MTSDRAGDPTRLPERGDPERPGRQECCHGVKRSGVISEY